MSNKKTKPGPPSGAGQITVTVHGLHDGDEVFFKINRGSGHRLRAEQTPNKLEMHEGDEIYANRVGVQSAKEMGKIPNVENKPPSGGGSIILKVVGIDGKKELFWIKRTAQLKKIMERYCKRQSFDHDSFRFLFNGRILRGEQTPDELGMEEGDEIHAILNLRIC